MNSNRIATSSLQLVLLFLPLARASAGETGWPVEERFSDHPLGATLGEFRDNNTTPAAGFQHTGIDILVDPWISGVDDASAPWVVATVPGFVQDYSADDEAANSQGLYTEVEIIAADGRRFRYVHLAEQSFDDEFVEAAQNMSEVTAGQRIARVTPWKSDCPAAYNHLHYDIRAGNVYLNPLLDIGQEADPDLLAPKVFEIGLARKRNRSGVWEPFQLTAQSCVGVKGQVEIVARVGDRDDAGSTFPGASNVGIYNLRWRACPENSPDCDAWSVPHSYSEMPIEWEQQTGNIATKSKFSMSGNWTSTFDECAISPANSTMSTDDTFVIATGSPSAPWNTTNGNFPMGKYIVTVEAKDTAGNVGEGTVTACVRND